MRNKKITGFLFLVTLVAYPVAASIAFAQTGTSTVSIPVNFSDVPATHKNSYAIRILKDANVVSGYDDGTFKPDQSVSRAEAVAIILKATGISSTKTTAKLPFTDVTQDSWYFPMIQKGVAMKKLRGYDDKTFRPNNPVTLPEALALTLGFFNITIRNVQVDARIYEGFATDAWYSKFAQYAKDKNLIEPDATGRVDIVTPLTRAQLAELIFRMRIAQQTSMPFDITSGWTTTEHQENFWKLKHPADWDVFKGTRNSVIWKASGHKIFFTRVWPTSARLSISVVDNTENVSAWTFFANAKNAYSTNYPDNKPIFSELTLSGRSAMRIDIPKRRITDIIIALSNKNFLVMYGEYGDAPIGEFLKKQLEAIMLSYQFVAPPLVPPPPPLPPLEGRMETLRENILVAGKWTEMAALFPDKKLIHTDAIGIGTGPVDYYYSQEAVNTIKLERSSGTVLNVKEGSTTNF